ncbi:winged helix-turn-helix transcriptional regulator [Streptomyces griseoloalbus]|uniref:winged helix-turn-helix transcriptional regulator n=1 Tax=Streptomyces griseoloalbus TaxID=67303 RepID=UPI0033BC8A84
MDSLLPADSPRLEGVNEDHVRVLADSTADFEPILVARTAGHVVDGMHRLRAAVLRGQRFIDVRYVDGSPGDLFLQSVKANTRHGLPLTLKDRKAAVARILTSHPHLSDRAIAAIAGVSPKTVGAARARRAPADSTAQPHTRVGRDGRARPIDIPQRREKALALLSEQPGITLREVAEQVGVSISTVHRMRQELRRSSDGGRRPEITVGAGAGTVPPGTGEGRPGTPDGTRPFKASESSLDFRDSAHSDGAPDPDRTHPAPSAPSSSPVRGPDTRLSPPARPSASVTIPRGDARLSPVPDPQNWVPYDARSHIRAMRTLANDPSVRFTDGGRALLRWLNGQAQQLAAGERMLDAVPPHCVQAVADIASHYAREWERLAETLRQTDRLTRPCRPAQREARPPIVAPSSARHASLS